MCFFLHEFIEMLQNEKPLLEKSLRQGFIMKGGVVPPGIPYLLILNHVGAKCAYFGPTFGAP